MRAAWRLIRPAAACREGSTQRQCCKPQLSFWVAGSVELECFDRLCRIYEEYYLFDTVLAWHADKLIVGIDQAECGHTIELCLDVFM